MQAIVDRCHRKFLTAKFIGQLHTIGARIAVIDGADRERTQQHGGTGRICLVEQVADIGRDADVAAADMAQLQPAVDNVIARKRIAELRSEEHTSELQSLMRISYAVFCLKKKKTIKYMNIQTTHIDRATSNNQTQHKNIKN